MTTSQAFTLRTGAGAPWFMPSAALRMLDRMTATGNVRIHQSHAQRDPFR